MPVITRWIGRFAFLASLPIAFADVVKANQEMWHAYVISGTQRKIVHEGQLVAFDHSKKSNVSAVRSLDALGHHVTSVNASLTSAILVLGIFHTKSKELEIRDWRIITPFFVRDSNGNLMKRMSLERSDFDFDDSSWITDFYGKDAVTRATFAPEDHIISHRESSD